MIMNKYNLSDYQKALYDKWVVSVECRKIMDKTTLATLKLTTDFEINGLAGCEDVSKFDYEIGCEWAIKDALNKLGEFNAFYEAAKKKAIRDAHLGSKEAK